MSGPVLETSRLPLRPSAEGDLDGSAAPRADAAAARSRSGHAAGAGAG